MVNGLQPEIKAKVVDKDPGTPKEVVKQAIVAEALERRKQTGQVNLIDATSASHISTACEADIHHSHGSPSLEWCLHKDC